jgi:FG-GAP-like repeat
MKIVAVVLIAACQSAPAPTTITTLPPTATPPPAAVGTATHVGACSFGPPAATASRIATGDITIGDLNNDKIVDLVIGGRIDTTHAQIGVMLGRGDGTFAPVIEYPLLDGGDVHSVALTDFDTDEDLDIVTAGGTTMPQVFLNNGDGSFGQAIALPARSGSLQNGKAIVVRVADIHGDAHPDVVTYAGGGFDVWHDSGHAAFVASDLPALERFDHGGGLAIADFNNDGATDIAVAGTSTVAVLLGRHGGQFAAPARYPVTATGTPTAVATADFDGDGKLDLAALFVDGANGTIAVLYNKGNGVFASPVAIAIANPGTSLVAADLNHDNHADLVASTSAGLATILSNGKGFDPAVIVPAANVRAIAAGDLRGDHSFGLVSESESAGITVWPGACP